MTKESKKEDNDLVHLPAELMRRYRNKIRKAKSYKDVVRARADIRGQIAMARQLMVCVAIRNGRMRE